jgi:hypothetical protein
MNDVFVARASELRSARELVQDEASYASATALLAVHSAISLNDALLALWNGKPIKSDDHQSSVRATESQCRQRKVKPDGVRHLARLIGSKSAVAYGDKPVTHVQALALAEAASRFEAWAYKNCEELATWKQH